MIWSRFSLLKVSTPVAHQNDVLMPLNPVHPVQRVIKRVEQIGLSETRNSQLIHCAVGLLLVLREVRQDVVAHVVGNHREPVVFFQSAHEGIGRLQNVAHEKIISSGELDQQDGRDRRFRNREAADLLRRAIFGNAEILLFQIGDELPIFGRNHNRHFHHGHIDMDGIVRHALNLFWASPAAEEVAARPFSWEWHRGRRRSVDLRPRRAHLSGLWQAPRSLDPVPQLDLQESPRPESARRYANVGTA